jgi:hypothetical protein
MSCSRRRRVWTRKSSRVAAEPIDFEDDEMGDGGGGGNVALEFDGVEEELAAGAFVERDAAGDVFVPEDVFVRKGEAFEEAIGAGFLDLDGEGVVLFVGGDAAVEGGGGGAGHKAKG